MTGARTPAPSGTQPLWHGDDCLVLGQRLSEWCGHAPELEVDLALANVALDLIGQANLWLDLVAARQAGGLDADALAFHRDAADFRCCLLVQQPNGDFGRTMMRQLLYSTWQQGELEALSACGDAEIMAIAAKAAKEVRYHAELAADWVIRLGDGTAESHARAQAGLAWCWRFVGELFERPSATDPLHQGGFADAGVRRAAFDTRIAAVLAEATLQLPDTEGRIAGGRSGRHSEHLAPMLAVMQALPRAHPQARW